MALTIARDHRGEVAGCAVELADAFADTPDQAMQAAAHVAHGVEQQAQLVAPGRTERLAAEIAGRDPFGQRHRLA